MFRRTTGWRSCDGGGDVDRRDRRRARAAADVKTAVPHFDGARLDDIVDYLTYVFAPVFLMYRAGVLPEMWGVAVAAIVLLSSATALPRPMPRRMTTSSPAFRLTGTSWRCICSRRELPQAANAAILLVLSALVFVRIGYVYPTRTPDLRVLTLASRRGLGPDVARDHSD